MTVSLPGGGEPVTGKIRLVSPMVDATTRLGRIRVALPASRGFAPAASPAAWSRSPASRLVVPRTAIIADADTAVVQVVRDGTSRPARSAGITTGSAIEILTGLKPATRSWLWPAPSCATATR